MSNFLKYVFYGRQYRKAVVRWARMAHAEELGIFDLTPSQMVDGAATIGVDATDNMPSAHMGAPDSMYYDIQEPKEFDAGLKKVQKSFDSLLKNPL